MKLSKNESKCRKKYFAETHIKKGLQTELDMIVNNSRVTYKGLLKQHRLREPIKKIKNSKINISTRKVYIGDVEIDGIYEMVINNLNESALSLDALAKEASQMSVSFRQLASATTKLVQR